METTYKSRFKQKYTHTPRDPTQQLFPVWSLTIVSHLVGLSRAKLLPSVRDYNELKEDLEFKSSEAGRAQETLTTLETDKGKLKSDFNKLEQLEAKINSEMVGYQMIVPSSGGSPSWIIRDNKNRQ